MSEGNSLHSFIGCELLAVEVLLFDPPAEDSRALRIAVGLSFTDRSLVLRADAECDTLDVIGAELDGFRGDPPECYRVESLSATEPFRDFLGAPLHNWWFLQNDAGLRDGFVAAFAPDAGLSFVTMAGEVSVQVVRGEQFA
jgi:hypothetical protein